VAAAQDSQSLILGGATHSFVWPPVALGLFALAVGPSALHAWAVVGLCAGASYAEALWRGWEVTPVLAAVVGAGSLWYLSAGHALRWPVRAYCTIGGALYVGYALTLSQHWAATSFWAAQHVVYLAAFGLFAHSVRRLA
jgi:hypothetical protein